MNRIVFILSLVAISFSATANPAQAYLDPGNGSMLVQILVGGAAGVAVGLKYYWHQITAFFQGKKSVPDQPVADKEEI